ncbi:MAG: hypothetical protein JSS16_11770, partial [Proteobacteria bacterium]|nr:hypothetical protein [Pseudomonadota bacterium]
MHPTISDCLLATTWRRTLALFAFPESHKENVMSSIAKLNELRSFGGAIRTRGLDDATVER